MCSTSHGILAFLVERELDKLLPLRIRLPVKGLWELPWVLEGYENRVFVVADDLDDVSILVHFCSTMSDIFLDHSSTR